ncbi:L,D-transpeptidase family protein [candidate division KSB1 bacterium]|nr:L,D-transpeptidase family protein [candidate division KSB1 bacterium]
MKKRLSLQSAIYITGSIVILIAVLIIFVIRNEPSLPEQISVALKQKLSEHVPDKSMTFDRESTHSDSLMRRLYHKRDYRPVWIFDQGPASLADSLLDFIRTIDQDGLKPHEYHLPRLDSLIPKLRMELKRKLPADIDHLLEVELLLTDAFLLLASHLVNGRLNQETIDPEWLTTQSEADLIEILNHALHKNKIRAELNSLLPQLACYKALRKEMNFFKDIARNGGWSLVPAGPTLQKGDSGFRVAALSARLITSKDMPDRRLESRSVFDDTLEAAVRRFQERQGINADGVVGSGTLELLNKPALYYIHKIAVNMERWRWLPSDLGERYIIVNIADFSLDVIENGVRIMTMPVVVGKQYRRTPVFSGMMTYIVLNPYWYVPQTIMKEDILPQVQRNPGFLVQRSIEVIRSWKDREPIDPFSIDWDKINASNNPYLFRQAPGVQNALGRIKFMFPNKYDIYLHDTPHRSQFDEIKRTFSSGCIRLEKPIDLAEYVLLGDTTWSRTKIINALKSVTDMSIELPQPIPVYLFYCTAWVNDNGIVHFRDDIYNRDVLVEEALREKQILDD